MKGLAAAVITVLALVPTGPAGAAPTDEGAPEACRQQWSDLAQLHGENGNPRGPVPALTGRWAATYRRAVDRAATAPAAGCGARLEEFAAAWDRLEGFQYDLYAFDPRDDLRDAEGERRHYLGIGGTLSSELRRAFRVIRAHTPGAVRDLAPALEGAAGVDLDDRTAVRTFLREARRAKQHSRHVQRMRQPYRLITDAELDEE